MRLIDADKLRHELIMGHDLVGAKYTDLAETVKAITVEWIDGYIKRRANDVNIYAEILFISDMVKEWEKENEKKRRN